ncbi:hypothetical protein pEaSNUABM47_00004 [Erwinia phage pEa_SNUABM_47]|uniref:Uncharacterized protein n=2 Tax=Eneladusvirus BF TaxID=2560751 RepID=A0A7L8ZMQ3_9CAUD|nr:hypothetical protein pEaSNUABM12_00005 [Erwinia phage pEa_SNUABM_12]QOI71488.1 hypothetical protein pEaSNUABM47_00004 [Erwinia phage pEa_SNUABM_47]QXO12251.1 hypothetical protein pEaSNUABM49_00005 [Erwinia phage pEa_SNUABM_49]
MERNEQFRLVLEVLENMQACLDVNDTYVRINGKSFNLNRHAGICWHVLAYTPNSDYSGIGLEYLSPLFVSMGLHPHYPVEMQIVNELDQARWIHSKATDQYNILGEEGKIRRKLLKDLIQYYKKELAIES